MTDCILDASAVLADILGEPGADVVRNAGSDTRLSTPNLTEVVAKLVDKGFAPNDARAVVARLACKVVSLDEDCAVEAGLLRAATRRSGLSLGDLICIALAARDSLPILTADRAWAEIDLGVEVRLIR